jgi:ABC-type transporter Mla MlaB component
MTLRIERLLARNGTRIRLSGELRVEQLDDLSAEIAGSDSPVALDLDELGHVDINAVRFLMACESEGVELVNCSPFIREWMAQERATTRHST